MQRQRSELVPIGEVVSGLDDVPAIRDDSPQAQHYFTQAASEPAWPVSINGTKSRVKLRAWDAGRPIK